MRRFLTVWLATVVLAAAQAATGWRGDGTGCYADARPPVGWGNQSNVLWRTALPQWSNASPVPVGDRVYVCAEPATLVCVSLTDGQILWQRTQDYADVAGTPAEAAEARAARTALDAVDAKLKAAEQKLNAAKGAARKAPADEALKQAVADAQAARDAVRKETEPFRKYAYPGKHDVTGQATPTPVADEQRVYVLFAIGTVGAYTPAGERVWGRDIGRPKQGWGHSASPLLSAGVLIVHLGDKLHALDAATGATRWSADSRSGWGTPSLLRVGGKTCVLTPSGDLFDLADGRKLADQVLKFPWNGPVVADGVAYKVDEDGAAAVGFTDSGSPVPRWQADVAKKRYYASSLVSDGLVYNLHQDGLLTVLDAGDGKLVYSQNIDFGPGGKTVYPSPVGAAGRVYLSADNGMTVVIAAGREFRMLARNKLDAFRATPACSGTRLLVRTLNELVCLADGPAR